MSQESQSAASAETGSCTDSMTIMGAVAQLERDLTIKRINSGLETARSKGNYGGRTKDLDSAAVAKAKALKARDVDVADIARTPGVSRSTTCKYLNS